MAVKGPHTALLTDEAIRACAHFVMDQAKYVIDTFGPRPPASEAERRTQEHVHDILAQCCDETAIEAFQTAPRAFMSLPLVTSILVGAGLVLYWINPWASFAISAIAAGIVIQQLVRYKRLLDPFFPKATSYNVIGRIHPSGERKRRIVLNGHPDAAYEWRWNYMANRWFAPIVLYSFSGLGVLLVTSLLAAIFEGHWHGDYWNVWGLIGLLQLLFAPGVLVGLLYTNFGVVAPGANDNLSGTFTAVGIAKYLRDHDIRLEHTELAVLITGSEEAGLRGAKAFAEQHANDFDDVETVFVALDTFRDLDHFKVYNRDLNGRVAHDEAVCRLLKEAGTAAGLELPYGTVTLGASDGAAFTQAGWRTGTLAAMDPAPAPYYHTRLDTANNMEPFCLQKVIETVLAAVRRYDAEGLPPRS